MTTIGGSRRRHGHAGAGTHLPRRRRIASPAALLGLAAGAIGAGPLPGPSGVYHLRHGFYVQRGVPCGAAPNAAIRRYDGKGISDAHSRSCRVHVISRRGGRAVVDQSCIDAGAGPAPRVVERQTVTVHDPLTFDMRTAGTGTLYRYCPERALPPDLRGY